MKQPRPIVVDHLVPEVLDALLDLLSSLSAEEWARPIVASTWTVKDTALHLLGDDVGILSRRRDGFSPPGPTLDGWHDLVAFINHLNDTWLQATRRTSPRLLCDLLRFTGEQVSEYFQSLDPMEMGDPVGWAGPEPAPVWLDLAREYIERWHHQQHIRDAVGKPGLTDPKYLAPVLDALVRALPHTYREVGAAAGTLVALTITGNSGGQWFLLRQQQSWNLYLDCPQSPDTEVSLPEDVAWRLFTKGLSPELARGEAIIAGDQALGLQALDMVSIIA